MLKRIIQILLIGVLTTLATATAAHCQETTTPQKPDSATTSRTIPRVDECSQLLEKTLIAFEALKDAKTAVDAELATNKELRAKEEAYNAELLKAVALLTSSEKRNKSFFKKLLDQLGKVLKAATKPETLATIATMIVLVRGLK
jgi:hypothetical protein